MAVLISPPPTAAGGRRPATAMRPLLQRAARAVTALLGGYAFAWGTIAAGTSGLYAMGMGFHDAEFLATLLGVLVFLVAFLWTFAVHRLRHAWLLLIGGGGGLAATGSLLQAWLL